MLKNLELYNKNIEKAILANEKFEDLKNKSILITGANGLIASSIIDVLNWLNANRNYNIEIIALIRNKVNLLERFKKYSKVTAIEQDVIKQIRYYKKVDYIIHAASNSHPEVFEKDPVGTILGNFIGIKTILEFALKNNVKKVEYISSGEIYGQGEKNNTTFEENDIGKINPMNPRSSYPLSKLASENLCISYSKQYNVNTVIARLCYIYGPTQTKKDSRVIAQFINNALNNEDIIMKSEGTQIRSYCYVIDCVTAILRILIDGENCNAYNVANKNSILSIKEIADIMAKKINKKVRMEIPENTEKQGYSTVTRAVLDSNKLEKLGWIPCWNFEEGIEATIKILR